MKSVAYFPDADNGLLAVVNWVLCARSVREFKKWHMIKVNKKYYFKVEQLQIFKCVVGRTETKTK